MNKNNHGLKKQKKLITRVAQKFIPNKIQSLAIFNKLQNKKEDALVLAKTQTYNSDLLQHKKLPAKLFDSKFLSALEKLEDEGMSNLDIYKKLPTFSMELGEKLWHYSHQLIHQDKQELNSQLLDKVFIEGKELTHEKEQTEKTLEADKKRSRKIVSAFPIMSLMTVACVAFLPHIVDGALANVFTGCWAFILLFLTYVFYQADKEANEDILSAEKKLDLLKSVNHEEAINLVNMIKQDDFAKLYHSKIINEKRSFSTLEYQLLQHLHLIQNKNVHEILTQKVDEKKKYLSKSL